MSTPIHSSEKKAGSSELLTQRDWLQGTLFTIPDAIATGNPEGAIVFLNPAAEALTGWTQAEAAGAPIESIVCLNGEASHDPVNTAVTRVLKGRTAVELHDRSMLTARDGTKRAVAGSASPILNSEGGVAGVVLSFRDCSERRRLDQTELEAVSYSQEILATLKEPFLVLDTDLRVRTANQSFYKSFQVSPEQTDGRLIYELGNGQWDIPVLRHLLEVVLPKEIAVKDFSVEHNFPAIGFKSMLLTARRFPLLGFNKDLILLGIEDVTAQRETALALENSELRFRRLFQTAKDGILILDATNGTIIDANPFMCGLLGYSISEFLGKELWEIGLFEDKAANQTMYSVLSDKGYVRYEHLPLSTKKGEEVEVEFISNTYKVGDREVAQCNIRDVTQRRRMEKQVAEQATALADLHRRKDEFLAILSHELRNPLSPILNAVHILRIQGDGNLIQQQARKIIERQVGQLSHLLDDLLEVARFTSGKIALHPTRLDMRGVVERAVQTCHPLVERRQHYLSVDLPQEPIWLNADPGRLEQVVVNLLNNAAKYTDPGGKIWIRARNQGDEMVLTVRDTGVGIDLKTFPEIFDLFAQVSRSLDRSQGGLGVGLSLVQRIMDMHGGKVQVFSEGTGRGSEFTIRLPLEPANSRVASIPTEPVEFPAHARRLIVVDDNVDAAETLADLLRLTGHNVRTAYNGTIAIQQAQDDPPDIMLLDIGLPGLNGYEVARRMRHDPKLAGVHLIAVTGYGQEADVLLAKEAGFDEHIVKPVDFTRLKKLMNSILSPAVSQPTESGPIAINPVAAE